MSERLEGAALLLILALALLADGLMESLGPGGFLLVSVITLTAAEALRLLAGIKRKAPCIHADQSQMQETHTRTHKGPCTVIVPRPLRKYKEEFYTRIIKAQAVPRRRSHPRNTQDGCSPCGGFRRSCATARKR